MNQSSHNSKERMVALIVFMTCCVLSFAYENQDALLDAIVGHP